MKSLIGIPSSRGTIPPELPPANELPPAKAFFPPSVGVIDRVSVQPAGWTWEPASAATSLGSAFAAPTFRDVALTGATPPK